MKCILRLFLFIIFLIIAASAFCESLWGPDFPGYLSSGKTLKPGDIILVSISTKTMLSFVTSSNNDKTLTFEFTGGEGGDLFSFLPAVKTSGSSKLKGNESITLESEIVTLVKAIDEYGNAYLEGTRNIEIDGKGESLQLTGTISGNSINSGKKVQFSQLVNSRLVYSTFITPIRNVLTDEDIIRAIDELTTGTVPAAETATAAVPLPAEAAVQPVPDTAAAPVNTPATAYTLSDTKKKELLLQYINKFINLIFN